MVSLQKNVKYWKPDYNETILEKNVNVSDDNITSFIYNPNQILPIRDQRERLPIRKHQNQILFCLEKYQVIILVGETGCGKSTQVPQYLFDSGWHTKGMIGITEPRRISAITLADRVALERGETTGDTVGFVVKFAEKISNQTKIKYMTEGILLRELLADPLLTQYSLIMVDEVHERNLLTDTLLGLLKKIVQKNNRLKLIISSATIDASFFKDYFNFKRNRELSSVILSAEGAMYPVNVFYLSEPCPNYVHETVSTIVKIHNNEPRGDILAFLTGQEEVLEALNLLNQYKEQTKNLIARPMYGSLSSTDQLKVFFTPGKGIRKVIIATNIAETSITIPGIVYVIDCGFVKLKWFNPDSSSDNLVIVPISKASATQRAGRAGRTQLGKVYRLYTEKQFENLPDRIPPDVRRTELSSVVLLLKALGIGNILRFDFPSAPPAKNLLAALETLNALDAIDANGELTKPIGYFIAEMPLASMVSKMIYASAHMNCTNEILIIIAMLQVENIFSKPVSTQSQARQKIAIRNFEVMEGDLITLLNIFTSFVENGQTKEFCGRYFLIYRNLKRAVALHKQLASLTNKKLGITSMSCNGNIENICKCITAGLFLNAAYLHSTGVYKSLRTDTELFIHPLSSLYTLPQPQYVVYTELLQTSKLFMSNLTVIKKEWLTELAPRYYIKTTSVQ